MFDQNKIQISLTVKPVLPSVTLWTLHTASIIQLLMIWKLKLNKTPKLLWLMMTHSFLWWHKKTALSLQRESRLHTNTLGCFTYWGSRQFVFLLVPPAAGSLQPSDCVTYYRSAQKRSGTLPPALETGSFNASPEEDGLVVNIFCVSVLLTRTLSTVLVSEMSLN